MAIDQIENDPNKKFWEREAVKIAMEILDEIKKHTSWEGLFTKRTPDQLLWGYTDSLLQTLQEVPKIGKSLIKSATFAYSVSAYVYKHVCTHTHVHT